MSKSSLVATARQTRGFTQGRTAVLMLGVLQGLSAVALFAFAAFGGGPCLGHARYLG
jgi:hypothetical protein